MYFAITLKKVLKEISEYNLCMLIFSKLFLYYTLSVIFKEMHQTLKLSIVSTKFIITITGSKGTYIFFKFKIN